MLLDFNIFVANNPNVFTVNNARKLSALIIAVMMLGIVGCGKKNNEENAKVSQSVVRVNGDEITVHQINTELQKARVKPEQQEMASRQIASALVDRQILVQEAIKAKLDRNPNVMQALENSKAQILAQAVVEQKLAGIPTPSDAEIKEYRAKNADIFANRKAFLMDEVAFVYSGNTQDVKALSDSAKNIDDVVNWLNTHQVKFNRTRAARAAETLPKELLEKLAKMTVGDLVFLNAKDRVVAGQILEIKDVPISDAQSKPLIQRILTENKRKQAIEQEMKRLRTSAKIEYINQKFAPLAQAPAEAKKVEEAVATPSPAQTPEVVTPEPQSVLPATSEQAPHETTKPSTHIEKGLSGL